MSDKSLSEATPISNEQKVSYGMGWQFGRHLLTHHFQGLDLEMAFIGVRDCLEDKQSPISDAEVEAAFKTIASRVQAARGRQAVELAEKSQIFLEENARREQVVVTTSGLQYEVVEIGQGATPGALNSVVAHYHGTFFNGEVFDSSVARGQPAEFAVQGVIPGWTEVLQLMPAGSKWRVFVPSELAYGEQGNPPRIPGNCALVFEIELIAVV